MHEEESYFPGTKEQEFLITQGTTKQLQCCNNASKNNSCSALKQKTTEARTCNVKILLSRRFTINATSYLDIIIENKMSCAIFCKQIKSIVIGKIFKLKKPLKCTRQHQKCMKFSNYGNFINQGCNLTHAQPVSELFLHSSA